MFGITKLYEIHVNDDVDGASDVARAIFNIVSQSWNVNYASITDGSLIIRFGSFKGLNWWLHKLTVSLHAYNVSYATKLGYFVVNKKN